MKTWDCLFKVKAIVCPSLVLFLLLSIYFLSLLKCSKVIPKAKTALMVVKVADDDDGQD